MDLKTKLKQALKTAFPGAEVRLEVSSPGSKKVAGFLVWNKFVGLPQLERQEKLWDVLDQELTVGERARITAILTATPEELTVVRGH